MRAQKGPTASRVAKKTDSEQTGARNKDRGRASDLSRATIFSNEMIISGQRCDIPYSFGSVHNPVGVYNKATDCPQRARESQNRWKIEGMGLRHEHCWPYGLAVGTFG